MTAFKKILVPTDFGPASVEAFRTAVALAAGLGAEVVVAHLTPAPAVVVENGAVNPARGGRSPADLWARFGQFVADAPAVRVTHEVVVVGRVSAAGIGELLRKFGCDLIVIGSHAHGRLRRLLRGSYTDEVVRRAPCPVLVVKAPRGTSAAARPPATTAGAA